MVEKKDKPQEKAPEKAEKAPKAADAASPQAHAKREAKKVSRWNLETCSKAASRFETVEDWASGAPASYKAAVARGLLPKCTAHMGKAVTKVTKTATKAPAKKPAKLPRSA